MASHIRARPAYFLLLNPVITDLKHIGSSDLNLKRRMSISVLELLILHILSTDSTWVARRYAMQPQLLQHTVPTIYQPYYLLLISLLHSIIGLLVMHCLYK